MPKKPLVVVAALAACDYLIWTWASDRGSSVLALITGLALAPLLLAAAWLAVLAVVRSVITRPMAGSQAPDVAARDSKAPRSRRQPVALPASTARRAGPPRTRSMVTTSMAPTSTATELTASRSPTARTTVPAARTAKLLTVEAAPAPASDEIAA